MGYIAQPLFFYMGILHTLKAAIFSYISISWYFFVLDNNIYYANICKWVKKHDHEQKRKRTNKMRFLAKRMRLDEN